MHKTHPTARAPDAGRKKTDPALLLLAPALLSILIFVMLPGLRYLPAAFMNWQPPRPMQDAGFVGLKWFREILSYYNLPQLVRNSVILGLWDLALTPVPMLLALCARHCGSLRIKKALDVMILVPAFIPAVTIAAVTQRMLGTQGLVNQLLAPFGAGGENWLLHGELFYAIFSLSGLWASLGFPFITYQACLSASSRDLHAAAQLDGASLPLRMLAIDLPLCRATFLLNVMMKIAGILNTSTERLLLFSTPANSAYSTTLDLYAYELTFKSSMMPAYSKSIALSLMLTLVNLALLFASRRLFRRKELLYE